MRVVLPGLLLLTLNAPACHHERARPDLGSQATSGMPSASVLTAATTAEPSPMTSANSRIELLPPVARGTMPLDEALVERRSRRSFERTRLTLVQLGQLAWAAQGLTDRAQGLRTA